VDGRDEPGHDEELYSYSELIPADQADQAALHADAVWTEDARLVGGIGSFKRN
jgi:hypothetical protein